MEHGRGLGRGPRKGRGTDPSRPEHRDAGHGRGAALRTAAAHISHVKQTCQITGLSLVKASGCFLWCFLNYCFGFQKFYTGTRHRGKLTGNRSRVVRLGRQSLSICTFNYPMLYPWINLELSNSKEALYDQRKFFSFLHQDRSPTSERKESYFLLVLTLRSQAPFLLLLAGALLLTPDNGAPGLR